MAGKRIYTSSERDAAIALVEQMTYSKAASELGIPVGTIAFWVHEARKGSSLEAGNGTNVAENFTQPASDEPGAPEYSSTPIESANSASETIAHGQPTKQASITVAAADADSHETIRLAQPEEPSASAPRRNVAKVYTPSERARALEYAIAHGFSAARRAFRISRFYLHNWKRQDELHNEGKRPNSPVAGSDDNAALRRDERILREWKKHPGLGPSQIRNQLRREGAKVSVHTVRCVLEENGYVPPKVRRVELHDQEYEAVRPNYLWHLDFVPRYIHKQVAHTMLILDDYSRFIVGGDIWDCEKAAAVIKTFSEAVRRHGKPEKVMDDRGSAFHSWKGISQFAHLLEELEVDQIVVDQPQTNGKLENLNGNIQKEFFNQEIFGDFTHARKCLQEWIAFYNFERTHQALGGLLVPADRYFGRADEVLAQIEAGHGPAGVAAPVPVCERNLDLFRLVSCNGQIEVHLMGHRILLPAMK